MFQREHVGKCIPGRRTAEEKVQNTVNPVPREQQRGKFLERFVGCGGGNGLEVKFERQL